MGNHDGKKIDSTTQSAVNTGGSEIVNLQASVSKVIEGAGDDVIKQVENSLVAVEISRRADMIKAGISKLREHNKELRKLKPDIVSLSDGGTKTEAWSKEAFESREKLQAKADKLEGALSEALANNNSEIYDKLSNLIK